MPVSPKDVLTDPKFQGLSPEQRREVLVRIDPKFRDLSTDQQQAVLNFRPPTVNTLPAGEISSGPKGVNAVKAAGQTGLHTLADWSRRNADLIGGTVGGIAGASGGPLGAIGGSALGGSAGEALKQLIDTARGYPKSSSMEAATDIGLSGLEQGGYEALGAGIGAVGKAIKPVSRVSSIASGARIGEFAPELTRVLPDIDKAAKQLGVSGAKMNVGQFEKVVTATERGLNQEFNTAIFPIAQQPVVAHDVAQAIRSQITPNLAKTAEGRGMTRYLQARAAEFDKGTWTVGELNRERELISKRLRAWHNAVETGQAAQAKTQGHIAADTAAEQALKDKIYTLADQTGTKPPGYFKDLKQRQSNLLSLMDATKASRERITKESVEREGAPLSQKVHLRGYLHPTSGAPGGVAGVSPSMFSSAQVTADKSLRRGFPSSSRSTANALRSVVGTTLSSRDIDALPFRVLFSNQEASPAQQ